MQHCRYILKDYLRLRIKKLEEYSAFYATTADGEVREYM